MISKTIGFRGLAYFQTHPYFNSLLLTQLSNQIEVSVGFHRVMGLLPQLKTGSTFVQASEPWRAADAKNVQKSFCNRNLMWHEWNLLKFWYIWWDCFDENHAAHDLASCLLNLNRFHVLTSTYHSMLFAVWARAIESVQALMKGRHDVSCLLNLCSNEHRKKKKSN